MMIFVVVVIESCVKSKGKLVKDARQMKPDASRPRFDAHTRSVDAWERKKVLIRDWSERIEPGGNQKVIPQVMQCTWLEIAGIEASLAAANRQRRCSSEGCANRLEGFAVSQLQIETNRRRSRGEIFDFQFESCASRIESSHLNV